jgi:hypothetical protein
MNKVLGLIVFLTISILSCKAQTDTLNKYNAQGKRHGYWICYLNDKFKVSDSIKASYIGFDLYDNGQNLTRIGKQRSQKNEKIVDSIVPASNNFGRFKLLNGKVQFYNSRSILLAEELFFQGFRTKCITYGAFSKKYGECTGAIIELVDFTVLYENIRGTSYCEYRDCSGKFIKKYWFRKGKKKWKLHSVRS